jgi:RNA polymerase sigma factor (sigma-70 family)
MWEVFRIMRSKDKTDSLPTRASLLNRIKDPNDQESWNDFYKTYRQLIYGAARKDGLSDAECQDVVQEVLLTVVKKIKDLKYDPERGSFKGLLRLTTKWRVVDLIRKRKSAEVHLEREAADGLTDPIDRIRDPHTQEIVAHQKAEWAEKLGAVIMERVLEQVNPKHFQIYDAYVLKGWPVSQVMETLGVSRAEVYLAKHRVGQVVKKEGSRLAESFV